MPYDLPAALRRLLPSLLLLATLAACASGRGDDDVFRSPAPGESSPGAASDLLGEVTSVATDESSLVLRTPAGETVRVPTPGDVPVYYRGERYRVENLEAGDYVRVARRAAADDAGPATAIWVEQSVQERRGEVPGAGSGPAPPADDYVEEMRVAGTVEDLDPRRGAFVLRTPRGERFTVTMPWDAGETTRREFARLREGDYVRLRGERLGDGELSVLAFE